MVIVACIHLYLILDISDLVIEGSSCHPSLCNTIEQVILLTELNLASSELSTVSHLLLNNSKKTTIVCISHPSYTANPHTNERASINSGYAIEKIVKIIHSVLVRYLCTFTVHTKGISQGAPFGPSLNNT